MPGHYRIAASLLRDSLLCANVSRCAGASSTQSSSVSRIRCGHYSSLGRPVLESSWHQQMVERAKGVYAGNPKIDDAMAEMLSSRHLILFMEGSLDHPKSLCAGNLSKIFTSLQITGISTVDLLQHPEILGYLCTHMNESVRNVLFKDGKPLLDYDHILELFKKGTLLQALELAPKPADNSTHKHFRDFLPVANY